VTYIRVYDYEMCILILPPYKHINSEIFKNQKFCAQTLALYHTVYGSLVFRFSDMFSPVKQEYYSSKRKLSKSVRNHSEVRDDKIRIYYCSKMFWQIRMRTKEFSVLE